MWCMYVMHGGMATTSPVMLTRHASSRNIDTQCKLQIQVHRGLRLGLCPHALAENATLQMAIHVHPPQTQPQGDAPSLGPQTQPVERNVRQPPLKQCPAGLEVVLKVTVDLHDRTIISARGAHASVDAEVPTLGGYAGNRGDRATSGKCNHQSV